MGFHSHRVASPLSTPTPPLEVNGRRLRASFECPPYGPSRMPGQPCSTGFFFIRNTILLWYCVGHFTSKRRDYNWLSVSPPRPGCDALVPKTGGPCDTSTGATGSTWKILPVLQYPRVDSHSVFQGQSAFQIVPLSPVSSLGSVTRPPMLVRTHGCPGPQGV